jgi:hypothetical protein
MPLLFSYGTLQREDVQLSAFGRRLQGTPDALVGFEASSVPIADPRAAAAAGRTHHDNVTFTGGDSRVSGTVYEVTDAELVAADEYERPAAYHRMLVRLASGRPAWVYIHAPHA